MAFIKKSWQDHLAASFGQESETARAAKDGLTVGGVYNATPPTIADGEFSRLQVNASGALITDIGAGEVIASLGTVNLVEKGTITSVEGGSIAVTSITGDLAGGTIDEVTLVPTVTTVSAVTNVANLAKGTVTVVDAVTSVTDVANLAKGTVTVVDAVTSVTDVANLAKGTVTVVDAVTSVSNLVTGTLAAGTVSTVGLVHEDRFATVISTAASTLGTIKPLVSGSQIFVTDLIISAGAPTNVEIGDGGTSTPILGTMHFAGSGGAVMNFRTPIATSAGSALVYKQSAATALTITASGYIN